jgi:hypothetical protein
MGVIILLLRGYNPHTGSWTAPFVPLTRGYFCKYKRGCVTMTYADGLRKKADAILKAFGEYTGRPDEI